MKKRKIFREYMTDNKKWFFIILLMIFIENLILYSFHKEMEIALYTSMVVIVILFLFIMYDFRQYEKIYAHIQWDEELGEQKGLIGLLWQKLQEERQCQKYWKKEKQVELEELKEYYTTWGHQIKTPLAAMKLILEEYDPSDQELLKNQIFRVEESIQMMLAYIRMGEATKDFVFKNYDMDQIIKKSIRRYSSIFIRKNLSLEYDSRSIFWLTDEKWLSFVLDQILSNALKYTDEGQIQIYWQKDDSLIIQDSGVGIAPEDLPRVREFSFTGINGRNLSESTGIGLYLCQQILEQLGHSWEISSTLGKGTKISIYKKQGK
ncbi:MAG: sensor histidine kinase [Tissierellia bacterium]|nr:sensor histidine kinase [Tissierellia bacterium]